VRLGRRACQSGAGFFIVSRLLGSTARLYLVVNILQAIILDSLGIQRRPDLDLAAQERLRRQVHLGFALLFLVLVMGFKWIDEPSMIVVILKLAAYTYGPLLGLFAFGMLTRRTLTDRLVPFVTVGAPLLCAILEFNQQYLLGSYRLGLELLMVNGILVFAGLFAISHKEAAGKLILPSKVRA
jgi:hypothetical protein